MEQCIFSEFMKKLSMAKTTETLADALPREITRVRQLQDQFKSLRGMRNVIVEPQIMLMESEIQQAIQACASGDVVEMMRCYVTLKEYDC